MKAAGNSPPWSSIGLGVCALVLLVATTWTFALMSGFPYLRTPLMLLALVMLVSAAIASGVAVSGIRNPGTPRSVALLLGATGLLAGALAIAGNLEQSPVLHTLALGSSVAFGITTILYGRGRLGARFTTPTLVWLGGVLIALSLVSLLFWLLIVVLTLPA